MSYDGDQPQEEIQHRLPPCYTIVKDYNYCLSIHSYQNGKSIRQGLSIYRAALSVHAPHSHFLFHISEWHTDARKKYIPILNEKVFATGLEHYHHC